MKNPRQLVLPLFGEFNIELEIKKSQRLLYWLIEGVNRHGIPPNMWSNDALTPEWVVKHFNVEMSYFTN